MDIILASKSPRRREILENTKVRFSVKESQVDEIIKANESPKETVMRLAYEKALDVANNNEESLVIGADTIVVINNRILGKPKNEEEAYDMIKLLSGKTHYVITGFALINLSLNKKVIDCEVSQVTFKELSEECIKDYLNTKESLDKAGAYGIQGYGGLLVNNIQGDYFNIVGLPISKISDCLKDHFKINLFYGG
ncbi:MAG: Maf family protein [Terrisporobacter othiniensis]|uniref:dTTP/UTP pyrophosphatase n=1 Tax=Terrisporobacter hibernicus TaxID=2813371 RepID=A0AAX2ZB96_9FIRM|nr:Maf family protein [Terrisporobacter hibernicus]MDU4860073.1 Maf family protein [Terrisporobacter othiniensis]MDU6994337.1 Maf family protein [Terrisporobacter othiniensis]UEL46518.1 Maf family protein [Terrisporobacter hibernicus]SFI95733.1 septum formation protein [Terrisporobacter glycolicus]